MALPLFAQEPGQWRLDTIIPIPGVNASPNLPLKARPGDDVRGWWWLPITNENLLIGHMNKETLMIAPNHRNLLPGLYVFPGAKAAPCCRSYSPTRPAALKGSPFQTGSLVVIRESR